MFYSRTILTTVAFNNIHNVGTRNNDVNKFATRYYNIIVVGDLKPRASKKKKKYII